MNYKPYAGYWFYGANTIRERNVYYASYGLLYKAPLSGLGNWIKRWHHRMHQKHGRQ